jgi:hypothetical protein
MAPLPFLVWRASDAILKVTVDMVLQWVRQQIRGDWDNDISGNKSAIQIKIIIVEHMKLQNRPDCTMLVVSLPEPQILAAHLNQNPLGPSQMLGISILWKGNIIGNYQKSGMSILWKGSIIGKLQKVGDFCLLKSEHNRKTRKNRICPKRQNYFPSP